jgi:hypothetical protein
MDMTPWLCRLGTGGGSASKPANADGLLRHSLISRSATSKGNVSRVDGQQIHSAEAALRFEITARPSLCILRPGFAVVRSKLIMQVTSVISCC